MKLIGFKICPYVQRVAILLQEKGIRHEIEYIDPDGQRPADFHRISPLGKVPVLLVGNDHHLFESAVILEYLDEIKKPALLPQQPMHRARHRSWMVYMSSIQTLLTRLTTVSDRNLLIETHAAVVDHLKRLESEIQKGPYFGGSQFSMVDTVAAPVFVVLDFLESIHAFRCLEGLSKVDRWREILLARPSVEGAIHPKYQQLMRDYIRRQNGRLAVYLKDTYGTPHQPAA